MLTPLSRLKMCFLLYFLPQECHFMLNQDDAVPKQVLDRCLFGASQSSIFRARTDLFMIPIEFYVKFNLTGRVKPNSERKKEETESIFFPVPRQNQCTELFSAEEKRIPKAIRGVVRRAVLVGMIKEHRGKLLVRSSRYI
jgi:hypothetical protein